MPQRSLLCNESVTSILQQRFENGSFLIRLYLTSFKNNLILSICLWNSNWLIHSQI